MPALFQHQIECLLRVTKGNLDMPSPCVSHVRHLDEKARPLSYQSSHIDVTIDFRELGESVVDDVFPFERRPILVEVVRNEDRDVIHPRVTRRATE